MEKRYFKENSKITVMKSLMVMFNLKASLKYTAITPQVYMNMEKLDNLRKAFIKCCTLEGVNEARLIEELEKRCDEIGIEIDSIRLRENCVMQVMIESKMIENMSPEQQHMLKRSKEAINKTFVFDILYDYFEEKLKKIIISELFKRIFGMNSKLNFTIKVSSELLEELFEEESIKNKENFFCEQLKTWATYNEFVLFVKYEIKERKEDTEKKDIFINIKILEGLLKKSI